MEVILAHNFKKLLSVLWVIIILVSLYLVNNCNYLLFHSLAETFSTAVAFALFMIIWNSQKFIDNNYLLIIGIAYLFIGGLGILHTLFYPGMIILKDSENYSIQLWMAGCYLESITFLLAFTSLSWKKVSGKIIFLGYAFISTLILLSIFYYKCFPIGFIKGTGSTAFKIIGEYTNCFIMFLNIWLLKKSQQEFEQRTFNYLLYSLLLGIISQIFLTLYLPNYKLASIIGHYFKIISFYMIYKAIIQTAVQSPYEIIFRELLLKQRILKQQASTDELTGLLNRRTALGLLNELTRLAQQDKTPLTVCFIDIDYLKQINDCYGHLEGDLAIATTARVIRDSIRSSDYLCRIGGDEFLLILPRCTIEEAKSILERAKESLNSLNLKSEKSFRIDFSYGIAVYEWENANNADKLIEEADKDMYKNKSGKAKKVIKNYHEQVVIQ